MTNYVCIYTHTDIIGHYNSSVRITVFGEDYDLDSRTTQFKVEFELQISGETFHGNFILLSEF